MPHQIGVELDRYETEEFLKGQGLGALGLANEGVAYTFPIAFAYDDAANRCIFRFIMTEDSMKQKFVSTTDTASLTVYEWLTKDEWKSVVVRGPIQPITDEDLAHVAALFSDVGEETALEVFNDPISEYETEWYELDITEATARGRFPGVEERTG